MATVLNTTTFTATATGDNVSIIDIAAQMNLGRNVIVDSGSTGTEAGNITTTGIVSFTFNQAANVSLTLQSGSGANLVGDITVATLASTNPASFAAKANHNFTSTGLSFQSIDLRSNWFHCFKWSVSWHGSLPSSRNWYRRFGCWSLHEDQQSHSANHKRGCRHIHR